MPSSTSAALNHFLAAAYFPYIGIIEFLSAIICAALIAWIVVATIRTNYIGIRVERFRHVVLRTNMSREEAKKTWARVQEHFYKGDENDLKIAVIEADKLLDEALREAGVRGTNPGERLKNVKRDQVPNLDGVWQAHRLRNQIAHEPNFRLKRDLAERMIGVYEETLKGLGLL